MREKSMKQSNVQSEATDDRVWQPVLADPNALHTKGGEELTEIMVCEELTALDRYVRQHVSAEVFEHYRFRLAEVMRKMCIAARGSEDNDDKPPRLS